MAPLGQRLCDRTAESLHWIHQKGLASSSDSSWGPVKRAEYFIQREDRLPLLAGEEQSEAEAIVVTPRQGSLAGRAIEQNPWLAILCGPWVVTGVALPPCGVPGRKQLAMRL